MDPTAERYAILLYLSIPLTIAFIFGMLALFSGVMWLDEKWVQYRQRNKG